MDNMTTNERRIFHRPIFDPKGVLVSRRELKFGDRLIPPATILPPDHGLSPRDVMVLWDQKALDTYPPGTEPDGKAVFSFADRDATPTETPKGKKGRRA